jgi:molybdopterin-guanine dinucleotide biosynthesis protein A
VLVCAADLPFVSPQLIVRLAVKDPGGAPAVVAALQGELQPLLGCYQPEALQLLRTSSGERDVRLRDAVASVGPALVEVEDPDELFNVNAPEDLLQAAAILDRRRPLRAVNRT